MFKVHPVGRWQGSQSSSEHLQLGKCRVPVTFSCVLPWFYSPDLAFFILIHRHTHIYIYHSCLSVCLAGCVPFYLFVCMSVGLFTSPLARPFIDRAMKRRVRQRLHKNPGCGQFMGSSCFCCWGWTSFLIGNDFQAKDGFI